MKTSFFISPYADTWSQQPALTSTVRKSNYPIITGMDIRLFELFF